MPKMTSMNGAPTELLDIVREVECDGEPVIIEEDGTPRVVVISLADFKEFRRMQKERAWEIVEEIRAGNADEDPDEIYRIVTEEVEAVRQEQYERRKADAARGR